MKRGSISNTQLPTIWVMCEVLLEQKGRWLYIGPKQEAPRRQDWLWAVSNNFKVIVLYVDRGPSGLLGDYEHKTFDCFQSAVSAFKTDMRAGLMIVDDPALSAPPNIVSFQRSEGIIK